MATHEITLTVKVRMEEMDCDAESSAEIAHFLVEGLIHDGWDSNAQVEVTDYQEV